MGRVSLDSKLGVFVVLGYNEHPQAVTLNPPKCSCKVGTNCVHILAAFNAARVTENKPYKPNKSLSVLTKKIRRPEKSGKKAPLSKDELNISSAPDSFAIENVTTDDFDEIDLLIEGHLQNGRQKKRVPQHKTI